MKIGANHLVLQNMRDDYPSLVTLVRNSGQPVLCDGEVSYELRNVLLTLVDPLDAMPLGVGTKFDECVAATDFIGAVADARELDDIERLIRTDHNTRLALHSAGRGASIQFLYRDEKLQLHVSAPSNDVVKLPYAFFVLTQLQLTIANVLGIEVGPYYHHAVTLFLGQRDTGLLDYLKPTTVFARPSDNPSGLAAASWGAVQARAKFLADVAGGLDGVNWETIAPSELWYVKRLAS